MDDYGITLDEPRNFGIGHKYLHYFKTGHLDFEDDRPRIEGHPDFYTNYTDKQAFPGINMSGRAMQTRLIMAMGGFITPYI